MVRFNIEYDRERIRLRIVGRIEGALMSRNYARRYAYEYNTFRMIFQTIWCIFIAIPIFWLFYKFEIRGRENIPKDRKFICAANHISHFDPFLVSVAVRKPIAYMAKKELFENFGFFTLNMDWLGAFAVNREKLEVSTLKTVKEVYKSSWMLGIFPQGGIRKNKTIEKINKGFAVISKAAKWDILPVSITGCEHYNWIPFKGKLVVKIGKPVSHKLSQEEIINSWGQQVADMCGYKFVESEQDSENEQEKLTEA